jgi:hypothetical protein
MAWFSICMIHQQRLASGTAESPQGDVRMRCRSFPYRMLRKVASGSFHENNAIFLLPALAVIHMLLPQALPDFRIALVVVGGAVYFPIMACEIQILASEGRIEEGYRKLFYSDELPRLPGDHFFG